MTDTNKFMELLLKYNEVMKAGTNGKFIIAVGSIGTKKMVRKVCYKTTFFMLYSIMFNHDGQIYNKWYQVVLSWNKW